MLSEEQEAVVLRILNQYVFPALRSELRKVEITLNGLINQVNMLEEKVAELRIGIGKKILLSLEEKEEKAGNKEKKSR